MRHLTSATLGAAALSIALAAGANAADMAKPVYTKAAPVPPAAVSWTGFYVGGDLGGAWTSNTGTWNPLPSQAAFGSNAISAGTGGSGFIGGVHAGYNYQFAPTWVAGLEGDWSWTKAHGSFSQGWTFFAGGGAEPGTVTNMSSNLNWVSSFRGRFGYLVTPNVMAYATGGVAWARIDYAANSANAALTYTASAAPSSTQTGFAVGGGLEWAMTSNWLLRAEYLYYRFNGGPNIVAQTPSFGGGFPSNYAWSRTSLNVARAGLSYKF
jgi:outer membrane immunogenic protein